MSSINFLGIAVNRRLELVVFLAATGIFRLVWPGTVVYLSRDHELPECLPACVFCFPSTTWSVALMIRQTLSACLLPVLCIWDFNCTSAVDPLHLNYVKSLAWWDPDFLVNSTLLSNLPSAAFTTPPAKFKFMPPKGTDDSYTDDSDPCLSSFLSASVGWASVWDILFFSLIVPPWWALPSETPQHEAYLCPPNCACEVLFLRPWICRVQPRTKGKVGSIEGIQVIMRVRNPGCKCWLSRD